MEPLVSVIIPTYNRAHVLTRAIDSVLAQSYRNYELIVVDDGSTDGTADLVQSLLRPEITLVRQNGNRGQNPALNAGITTSKGTYCAFLDSDDEWHPGYLSRVMSCFEQQPELGCVYTWANIVDDITGKIDVAERFTATGNIYREALSQGYVSHMITLVARRDTLCQAGLFDEDFEVCQDDDICIRLAKVAQFGLIPESLATIHLDAGNQLTRNSSKYAHGMWKLVSKFADEIVFHCGSNVLARHYERCGDVFWLANDFHRALHAYKLSANLAGGIRIFLKQTGTRLKVRPKIIVILKKLVVG